MKRLLTVLFVFLAIPAWAEVDISDRPELGTATTDDAILGVDASASAGERLRRIKFTGDNTQALTGDGTWQDYTAVTGTDDQTASEVGITDSGGYFTGTDAEAALQELGAAEVLNTAKVTDDDLGVNETYGSGWNADTSSPEKDDIYDYLHQFDADDDGDFSDEGWFPSASGAPTTATYITTTAEAGLSAETTLTDLLDDTPVNGMLDQGVTSNWAYDHAAGADPHSVYRLESEMGTASLRNAEDTLTNGSNLPDGAAIITYGTANWGGGSMTYPGAGIPLSTGSAWDTSYSLTTLAAALDGEDWDFAGTNTMLDNAIFYFGTDNDAGIRYDETDDRLEIIANSASDVNIAIQNLGAGNANLTIDGILGGPTATPTWGLTDSDSLDADTGIAQITANATTVTAGAVVSDVTINYKDGGDASGAYTAAVIIDGSDNQVEFQINTTLQAGDIIAADLAADVIDETKIADDGIDSEHYNDGSIDLTHLSTDSVDYTKTTGSVKALTPVTDDCDNFATAFTGANLYGGTFIANATGTCQLPEMAAGMNFSIITLGAIAIIIDTNAADGYLHNGVTGVEGANITNTSTAGDIAVVQYYTADDWLITTNGWTAE